MVRPTGAKAKSIRHNAFTAFALSERTPSYTATQGAVPAELALGYALSAPLGRSSQNLNPYNLTTLQPHKPHHVPTSPQNILAQSAEI